MGVIRRSAKPSRKTLWNLGRIRSDNVAEALCYVDLRR